jgi:hypothetical protein
MKRTTSASCPERGNKKNAHFEVKTSAVKDAARALVEEMELEINPETITADRVGRILGKMRFKKARDSKRKGWQIRISELERLALSYGIKVIEEGDA